MKLLSVLMFVLLTMCGDHSSNHDAVPDNSDDTGIYAEVLTRPEGNRFSVDILIYLDIIEIVDGHKIHGFGKKPLEVMNPTLNENPMETRDRAGNTRNYKTTIGQLNGDFKLRFEMDGNRYLAEFHLLPDDPSKPTTIAVHVVK